VSQGAQLKLKFKGYDSNIKIDIRFVDSKDPTTDHPWRIGKTIDFATIQDYSTWNEFSIPPNQLEEKGSFDNGWFEPQGLFDWQRVEYFEIVAEHHSLENMELWFDDIMVEYINPNGITEPQHIINDFKIERIFPNPFNPKVNFKIRAHSSGKISVSIFDIAGRKIYYKMVSLSLGENLVSWDGRDHKGNTVSSGI